MVSHSQPLRLVLSLLALGCATPAELLDPCDNPDEEADAYANAGQYEAEIVLRSELVLRPDADMADWFNLACALLDAGYPAEGWIEEVASRVPRWDPVYAEALDMLALEEDDQDIASRLRAEANDLKGL